MLNQAIIKDIINCNMEKIKILPGITTTKLSDWRAKIKEIKDLGIKEAALFLTCLDEKTREEFFSLIEKSGLEKAPHIHIKDGMSEKELRYLKERFKTQAFNIHPSNTKHAFHIVSIEFDKMIFVENIGEVPSEEELKKYAGLCLDFAHWENAKLIDCETYKNFDQLVARYPIGCAHISGIRREKKNNEVWESYDDHWIEESSQLDYLKNYRAYFPSLMSLEMENSIKEQLVFKQYIEEHILNN